MTEDFDAALEPVAEERRSFIKKLAMGTVFAAPTVASFTMTGIDAVYAQTPSSSANQGGDDTDGDVEDDSTTNTSEPDETTTTTEPEETTTTTQPNSTTTSSTTTTTNPNQIN